MKYNKAIVAALLSWLGGGGLVTLSVIEGFLPAPWSTAFAILLFVIPIAVYVVENYDREKIDAEKVLKDAKTGNITGLVHDGALFVREDLTPALSAGAHGTSVLSGSSGLMGDVERYAPALGKSVPAVTEVTAEIPKVEQAVHAAQAGLAGIAKLTDTPIAAEALVAAGAAPVAAAEKAVSALPVADLRKALGL